MHMCPHTRNQFRFIQAFDNIGLYQGKELTGVLDNDGLFIITVEGFEQNVAISLIQEVGLMLSVLDNSKDNDSECVIPVPAVISDEEIIKLAELALKQLTA